MTLDVVGMLGKAGKQPKRLPLEFRGIACPLNELYVAENACNWRPEADTQAVAVVERTNP